MRVRLTSGPHKREGVNHSRQSGQLLRADELAEGHDITTLNVFYLFNSFAYSISGAVIILSIYLQHQKGNTFQVIGQSMEPVQAIQPLIIRLEAVAISFALKKEDRLSAGMRGIVSNPGNKRKKILKTDIRL